MLMLHYANLTSYHQILMNDRKSGMVLFGGLCKKPLVPIGKLTKKLTVSLTQRVIGRFLYPHGILKSRSGSKIVEGWLNYF